MDNPQIDILMATYNGAAYLEEQLNSICTQTYTNWRLLIHDDGSTDQTLAIIKEKQRSEPRIILLEDKHQQLGAAQNFLYLLSHTTAPYCMFCDQDDHWMENKVVLLLEAIEDIDTAALAYANAYYYKANKPIPKKVTRIHPSGLSSMLFMNGGIQGCSLIFNRALIKQLSTFPEQVAMHDHLLTLAAATFGTIVPLHRPLMYYRQHTHNVTGATEIHPFRKIRNFLAKNRYVIDAAHFRAVRSFYQTYHSVITGKQQRLFQAYFRYAEHASLPERIGIILRYRFRLGQKWGVLFIKTLIRKPLGS